MQKPTIYFICKRVLIIAIIIMLFVLTGCNNERQFDRAQNEQIEIWKLAMDGKLKGIELPIGATKNETLLKLPKPIRTGQSEFGYRFEYEGFSLEFATEPIKTVDDLDGEAKIQSIFAEPSIVGWQGTTNDVKKMFGEPDQEFNDEAYGPAWNQIYKVGDAIYLVFIAESEGGPIIKIKVS